MRTRRRGKHFLARIEQKKPGNGLRSRVPFGGSESDRIKPGELDYYAKLLETCKEKFSLRIVGLWNVQNRQRRKDQPNSVALGCGADY